VSGYPRKYRSISRRKFLLSATGMAAGIGVAGLSAVSCSDKKKQSSTAVIEIDFIGPENLFTVYHSYFRKFNRVFLHYKTLEEALFTSSNGAIVFLPVIQKASVLMMLLEMDKDILTPYPLAKNFEEFDTLQKQSNLSDRRIAILDPLRFWEPVNHITNNIRDKIRSVNKIELVINQNNPYGIFLPPADGYTGNIAGLVRLVSYMLRRNYIDVVTRSAEHFNITKTNKRLELDVKFEGIYMHCNTDNIMNGWSLIFTGDELKVSLNSEGTITGIDDIPVESGKIRSTDPKSEALTKNIGDFINTMRSRKEPEVNSLDGMAELEFNLAAFESAGNRDFQSLKDIGSPPNIS
jgi:predicted dehydrogenase